MMAMMAGRMRVSNCVITCTIGWQYDNSMNKIHTEGYQIGRREGEKAPNYVGRSNGKNIVKGMSSTIDALSNIVLLSLILGNLKKRP